MAITTTIDELVNDVRVVDVPTERAKLQRLMDFYAVAVVRLAPDADDEAHNMALTAGRRGTPLMLLLLRLVRGSSNVMRFSGAASTLLPWRQHGGGGDDTANVTQRPQAGNAFYRDLG